MFALIMLISHTIADYLLQNGNIVKKKSNMELTGYLQHGCGLLITALPLLILVRILIVILLLSNQLSSIGLIIAIKSLARFKMMENKIFSEYYLLGTLLSVVYTFSLYGIFQSI